MGNWTVTDGVTSYYESLMKDVREIHKYKVVTVVVGELMVTFTIIYDIFTIIFSIIYDIVF